MYMYNRHVHKYSYSMRPYALMYMYKGILSGDE